MRTIARSILSSPTSLTGSGLGTLILVLGVVEPLLSGQKATREMVVLGLVGLALILIGLLSEDGFQAPWARKAGDQTKPGGSSPPAEHEPKDGPSP